MRTEAERPQGLSAFIWLLELELDRGDEVTSPVITRLTDHDGIVEWPKSAPSLTQWFPFPFTHTGFAQNSEGDLQFLDLSIDNVGLQFMSWLHSTHGLEGHRCKVYLVPIAGLDLLYPNHEGLPKEGMELTVVGCSANEEAVTLRLGDPNLYQVTTPATRYNPRRCSNEYGSGQCGYVINSFAAFPSCSKLIEACGARALDMASRGLPPILPGNFAAFPGLSRRRR